MDLSRSIIILEIFERLNQGEAINKQKLAQN